MARSIAKIKEQIVKLQREADSIQSSVIARIRKEIAQFELTVEHLFGETKASISGRQPAKTRAAKAAKASSKKAAGRPAKYADGQGNTWGGMGKRPQWVHAAIEAGRSLNEFLVTSTRTAPKAKPKRAPKTAPATPRKPAAAKNKSATKKPTGVAAPTKRASPATSPAKRAGPRKSPAKKAAAKSDTAVAQPAT